MLQQQDKDIHGIILDQVVLRVLFLEVPLPSQLIFMMGLYHHEPPWRVFFGDGLATVLM